MKLQARILVLLVPLVCGSLAFVGHFAYSNLRGTSLARAQEQVQSQLSQLQLALDAKKTGVAANMELFVSAPLLKDFVRGSEFERTNIYQRPLSRLFTTYQQAYPDYAEMAVLDESGRMVAGVFPLAITEDMLRRFPLSTDDTLMLPLGQPLVTRPSLLVVRKVSVEREERFCYLVVLLDLDFLTPMLKASSVGQGISFSVTNLSGTPLFSAGTLLVPSLEGIALEAEDVAVGTVADPLRVTSRPVFDSLRLVAMVSEKSLASAADALATRVLQIIAVVTLLTVLLVYFGLRIIVISRLRALEVAVRHIAEGDLQAPVLLAGQDEIAGLGASFEDMRVKLLDSQQRLNDYNKTLEQKVRERTQELVDTQQQLVLKEKLASTSVLTAGVAHEINNPVNFIHAGAQNIDAMIEDFRNFVTDILAEDADPELRNAFSTRFGSLQSQLQLVMEGSGRIRNIVQNLRIITHLDQTDLKPVDVVDGLEKSIALLEAREGQGIAFEQAFSARPLVMGYGAEINQLFMNILANACQAIIDRRKQAPESPAGVIRITASIDGDVLRISIRDNGAGMPAEVQERAFDAFFTTRDVGSGTGLGLSIAQAIVHKHDGHIVLDSSPGQGTTVSISLPVLGVA